MEVYDNFLDESDFRPLYHTVSGTNLPWFFNTQVLGNIPDHALLKDYQLTHMLYNNGFIQSQYYQEFHPLVERLNVFSLIRMKLNCNVYAQDSYEHGMHIDIPNPPAGAKVKTAVFYFNTNDGYTRFESNNQKVESVENRCVIFDSAEKHTGSNPTNSKVRYVANINFIAY
jgi:hypothetical protein